MNGKNKVISTLGVAMLSIVLLGVLSQTASAKERNSRKERASI